MNFVVDESSAKSVVEELRRQNPGKLKHIFLDHGELEPMTALAAGIRSLGFRNVYTPKEGEEFEV